MRSLFIKAICYFSYYTGIIWLFYLLNRKQRVITYHNIIPDYLFDNTLHLHFSHSETVFKKHLQIVNNRFKITVQPGLKDTVMLTFDDGYANNFEIVTKILNTYNNPAIFFVPLSIVDSNEPLWIDRLMFWFSYVPDGHYAIFDLKFNITNIASRLKSYEAVYIAIIQDYSFKNGIYHVLEEQYSFQNIHLDREFYRLRFTGLKSQEIDQMKVAGHYIASHGVKHDILSKLDNDELRNSLETTFHSPIYNNTYISYPFGGEEEISLSVIEAFRVAGYTHAFTNIKTNNEDLYLLSRFSMPNCSDKVLIEAELSGFMGWMRSFFK
jgi:peptidoglycan/xylan/chitin deacetylase (PgdA/CDA1 family)